MTQLISILVNEVPAYVSTTIIDKRKAIEQ